MDRPQAAHPRHLSRRLTLALVAAPLAAWCSFAHAQTVSTAPTAEQQALAAQLLKMGDGSSLMRAYRDPATGALRKPEYHEAAADQRAAAMRQAAAAKPAQVQLHASGAKSVVLDERFMHYALATRKADGSIDFACEEGHHLARQGDAGDKHDR
jgi:hypothetical protein